MDFFQHQERARRKTGLLIIYLVVAVVLIVALVYLAVAGAIVYGSRASDSLWFPDIFAAVALGTLGLVGVGSLYKILELSGGGEVVARSLGGRRVIADTTDLRERVLLNVVEEMAIAAGTPVPPVYLMEKETAINAFAAGTTPQNAVIGVTRGTIETLSRDELQGVIAHEFSHILNGDMRLNIRLIGILNGILLIAIIGEIMMRAHANQRYDSNDDSNRGKGTAGIVFLGLCLYAIGFIGVFFARLGKSAVSRQREYLADASAVQFTRLPDGIGGALKKIGGLSGGSRLRAPNAEEASHMFFGNALSRSFIQLLSTHPPLADRILRIDPSFDGRFPEVESIRYTADDVIDPHQLASRLAGTQAHDAARDGAERMAFAPQAAVEQVGAPRSEHVDYAAALIESLPPAVAHSARDPLGAVAIVYALLLDDDEPAVRQEQLEYLANHADSRAYLETKRILPAVDSLQPEDKLPVVSMVLPALKDLSPRQLASFRDDVVLLIKADKQVSLFEYAVHRLILKRLLPRLEPSRAEPTVRLPALVDSCRSLLSTLAYYGTHDDQAAALAFEAAAAELPLAARPTNSLPRGQSGLKAIDEALDQLSTVAPTMQKQVLAACAVCISMDGTVTIEEAELLRVISDALNCPMPPLLGSAGRARFKPDRGQAGP